MLIKNRLLLLFIVTFFVILHSQENDMDDFSFEELLDVKVISAGKRAESITDVSASIDVITRNEIEIFGYQTLLDILNSIQGIHSFQEGIFQTGFTMRGFYTRSTVAILVNNVEIGDGEILVGYQIPVEMIDRVEIIRGPMSIMYGSDALVGAINIVLDEKEISFLGGALGSNKMKSAYLRKSYSKNDLKFNFNASYSEDEGYDIALSDITDSNIDDLKEEDKRTDGKLGYSQVSMFFSGSIKHFYLKYYLINNSRKSYVFKPSMDDGTKRRMTNNTVLFGYQRELFEKFSINAFLRSENITGYDDMHHFTYDNYAAQHQIRKEVEGELDVFWNPIKQLSLMTGFVGYSMYEEDYFSDVPAFGLENNTYNFVLEDSPMRTWAIFEQIKYSPIKQLTFTAGLRLEQKRANSMQFITGQGTENKVVDVANYPKSDVHFIPSASVIYKINKNHLVKLMYGNAIRDNFQSGGQAAINVKKGLTDIYLESEESQTTELNYLMTAASGKIGLNISAYNILVDNIVVYVNNFDDGFTSWFENKGKQRSYGSEFLLKTKPLNNLIFDIGGSYTESRDEYLDIDQAYSPQFLGQVKTAYTFKTNSIGMTMNYVDEIEFRWNQTKTPLMSEEGALIGFQGERYGETVDDYFTFTLNLIADEILGSGAYASLNIKNLFNNEIRIPEMGGNSWANKGILHEGRTVKLNIGYKF